MNTLINKTLDRTNIGLLLLLDNLRHNLDIECLISANADSINRLGIGASFFGHVQQMVILAIVLDICKIYEINKTYDLNSIYGVFRELRKNEINAINNDEFDKFIRKYNGPINNNDKKYILESTINKFRKSYQKELNRFKIFRDKMVAHAESGFKDKLLPSYDVMEKLFCFGADFHNLVSSFMAIHSHDLMGNRSVKYSLRELLQQLGVEDIKTELK